MQLKAIAFDWGHTVMDENRDREVPLDVRPIQVMPGVSEVLPHLTFPLALWANTRLAQESDVRAWLFTHQLGWEIRIASGDLLLTQVCRSDRRSKTSPWRGRTR